MIYSIDKSLNQMSEEVSGIDSDTLKKINDSNLSWEVFKSKKLMSKRTKLFYGLIHN